MTNKNHFSRKLFIKLMTVSTYLLAWNLSVEELKVVLSSLLRTLEVTGRFIPHAVSVLLLVYSIIYLHIGAVFILFIRPFRIFWAVRRRRTLCLIKSRKSLYRIPSGTRDGVPPRSRCCGASPFNHCPHPKSANSETSLPKIVKLDDHSDQADRFCCHP